MKTALKIFSLFSFIFLANQAYAKEWKEVRIGTEGAYPPFNYYTPDGHLTGFDIDIAQALCDKMKVKCTFVAQDWDGIIPALQAGKYDAIIASMSITDERKQQVAFTNKYYFSGARFIAPKNKISEYMIQGIKGKTIGVQRGTVSDNYAQDNLSKEVKIVTYDTQENANMDLIAGRIDLILGDTLPLYHSFLQSDLGRDFDYFGPEVDGQKWFGEGIGIATRKEDTELVAMFNQAIIDIRDDGTYKKVNQKYFPFDIFGK